MLTTFDMQLLWYSKFLLPFTHSNCRLLNIMNIKEFFHKLELQYF